MSVHEDTLQGLREIRDYVRGDKTKARSMTVEVSEEEIAGIIAYISISLDEIFLPQTGTYSIIGRTLTLSIEGEPPETYTRR